MNRMAHLEIHGTRLHYEDAGTGPALLLLHGWGTSGRVWSSCLPDLVRDHRVVTLDWRGCGRSDHPADGNTIEGHSQLCKDGVHWKDDLQITYRRRA